MEYILFVIGFVILIYGAEYLIEGSSIIAKKFGISDLIIGLTVVAFGTSLPELIVNLFAGAESGDLAIGNVLGSNISNTLLILGICAIIHPLKVHRKLVYREIVFNLLATMMLGILVAERFLEAGGFDGLDRIDGIVLMSYFIIFLYYTFGRKGYSKELEAVEIPEEKSSSTIATSALKIILGITGLFLGGRWIVDGAISIAELFNVSDALIGLTIVAIGTSLPELAASVVAVKKSKVDIAVGNIVGSNLFNIFWVLGLGAYVNPMPFSDNLFGDVVFAIAVAGLLLLSMVLGKYKHQISKREGYIFVALYFIYLGVAVLQG